MRIYDFLMTLYKNTNFRVQLPPMITQPLLWIGARSWKRVQIPRPYNKGPKHPLSVIKPPFSIDCRV